MGGDFDARFLPEDAEIIKHKVRKLIGRYGLTASDAPDLQQELALHVSTQMARYDRSRAKRSTFVDRIASNKLANIIEGLRAKKRGGGKTGGTLDAVSEERLVDARATGGAADLSLDVLSVLTALPPALLEIAALLATYDPAEVARMLGLTRGQFRQRRAAIRDCLMAAGLNPPQKFNQPKRRRSR